MSLIRGALPGEYLDLDTPFHSLPALIKAAVVIATLLVAAMSGRFMLLGGLALGALAAALLARMPWRSLRSLLVATAFFCVVSLAATLVLGGADGAWFPATLDAAAGRVLASGRATLRAMTALLLLGTFTLTTPPEKIVDELSFLRPRRHGHFRSGALLLAVLIALRLVPLLAEELVRLRRARAARGVRFDRGGRRERLADLRDLYTGYLAALLRRIDDMTLALEARGYRS